ncbi:MAG: 30S ribosomal protein S11 [Patescibacteria group bacterium]
MRAKSLSQSGKKRLEHGVLHIEATYNNTKVVLTDVKGNSVASSSSGALGFAGAKKGTPFAAAKVGELLADKGIQLGLKDVDVMIKGVGAGRESAVRAFIGKGLNILSIKDVTPVPHNGPKPPRARRV